MESVSNVHNNNRVNHRINHQNTTFVRTTTVAGATRGSRNNSGTIPTTRGHTKTGNADIDCVHVLAFLHLYLGLPQLDWSGTTLPPPPPTKQRRNAAKIQVPHRHSHTTQRFTEGLLLFGGKTASATNSSSAINLHELAGC